MFGGGIHVRWRHGGSPCGHPPYGGDVAGYRLTAIEVKETAVRLDGVLSPPEDAVGGKE